MKIVFFLIMHFFIVSLSAQELISYKRSNGCLDFSPLPDEQWNKVKKTYLPDSISYYGLTLIQYSTDELLAIDIQTYRDSLISHGVDSAQAYSLVYHNPDNQHTRKWTSKVISRHIKKFKKEYSGKYTIKTLSTIDSSDRFTIHIGYFNTADSTDGGFVSYRLIYFVDNKLHKTYPLIVRQPKKIYSKL